MKNSVKLLLAALGTVLIAAMSCTKEIVQVIEPEQTPEVEVEGDAEKFTCKMRLVGSRANYDNPETKAEATDTTWADGSIIYLRMESPIGSTRGEAIYSKADSLWTVNYYGSLTDSVETKCAAIYTENMVKIEGSIFNFDENTIIYEDLDASYIFYDGELTVTASLKPKTGRIRFAGDSTTVVKVYGVTHYTSYNIDNNTFTTTSDAVKLTVGSDGYTPYLYGYFTETNEPTFKVWINAKEAYTKFCSKKIFQAGQSGKLTIPTADKHNGWLEGLHFNVNNARFKMVAVEGGTFSMGDSTSTNSYLTAHPVTLTGFCMAEAEMTILLYNRLISATSEPYDSEKPKTFSYRSYYSSSYADVQTTMNALNSFIGTNFDIPTEAQWEYAAKGGQKSKGYLYSGSDNLNDVGWYSSNYTTHTHEVKTKSPNELGIYDMSGNVEEYVKDYYNTYPSSQQYDPYVGPESGLSNMVKRGGDYNDSASYCTNTYRTYTSGTGSSSYAGIRLVLNWNY